MERFKEHLATAKNAAKDLAAKVKKHATTVVEQNLNAMKPEDKAKWEARRKAVAEHASDVTNALTKHVATATEKVKEFGKNAATLTASNDVTQSAIKKIEQLCSKYQKAPRPGSVAADLKKTAGRRKNGKRTIRKRR